MAILRFVNRSFAQTFGYDGFGNLTSKSVPAGSSEFVLPGVNAAKNWLNGSTYDQNGNVATLNNATLSYDVENRLSEYTTGSFVENYAYDEANRRVDKFSSGADNVYFYGPNGKLLTVVQVNFQASAPYVTMTTLSNRIYFGGMLLGTYNGYANLDSDVMRDRLGSVQPSFAYGTATGFGTQATADGDDFATYLKDSNTGFEYAMNRYYSAGYGRFLTADPFGGSAKAGSPMSWNRYAYGSGDPVNRRDVTGLCPDCDDGDSGEIAYDDGDSGGGGGDDDGNAGGGDGGVGGEGSSGAGGGVECDVGGPGLICGIVGTSNVTTTPVPTPTDPSDDGGQIDGGDGLGGVGATGAPTRTGPGWPSRSPSECSAYSPGLRHWVCAHAGGGSWSNSVRGCLQTYYYSGGYIPALNNPVSSLPGAGSLWNWVENDMGVGVGAHAVCFVGAITDKARPT